MGQSDYWKAFMERRLSRRRVLQAGAIAGAGLWVGSTLGCGGGSTEQSGATSVAGVGGSPTPQKGGTIRVNLAVAEPVGIDPYIVNNTSILAYEKLVKHSPKRDKILPVLALSWEQPDELTYIFKLKQGVKFHNVDPVNGREMTAEDAKFSMERTLSKGANYNQLPYFQAISKVEAVDKYTLKITTGTPFAPLLNNMAFMPDVIMPKEIVGADNVATKVIGTGPFMLDRWDKGEKMLYKRNPDYHVPDRPYVDAVEYKWSVDYTSLVAVFISDQADMASVYAQDMKTIKSKRPKAQIQAAPALTEFVLGLNCKYKPLSDLRVRTAMDLVFFRHEVGFRVAGGTGETFDGTDTGPLTPNLENWAIPVTELQKKYLSYAEDYTKVKADALAQAKKLMADAGYADGFDLQLINCPEQYRDMTAVMAQEWWKQIGINVTIKQMDQASFITAGIKGDFQALLWYTGFGDPDPDGHLYGTFHTGSINNYGKWSDAKLDKMLDDQRAATDVAKRKSIVTDIQNYILEQRMGFYIYDFTTYTAVNERLHGYEAPRYLTFTGWDQFADVWFSK